MLSPFPHPERRSAPWRWLWLHPEWCQRELNVCWRHCQHRCLRIPHHQPQAPVLYRHRRWPIWWRSGSWAHLSGTRRGNQGHPPGTAHGWPSGTAVHSHPAPTTLPTMLWPSQAQTVRRLVLSRCISKLIIFIQIINFLQYSLLKAPPLCLTWL